MAEKRAAAAKKAETAEKNAKDLLRDQDEGSVFISDADMFVFGQGSHYDIYKKLGRVV